jgi:uncharacterized damage-inducible protein DinB
MFEYDVWANGRLFAVLSEVTPDQFTQDVAGSYGSIRNTLVHVLSAEWGWIERCGGAPRGAALKADDYPTLASVTDLWSRVAGHAREFLASLRNDDLDRTIEFALGDLPRRAMPVGQLLQHAANHSVHHRGQIALLLRSLGYAPGNVDILIYYMQAKGT